MPQTVVDRLEVIDVQEKHGDRVKRPVAPVHGVGKPVEEQGTIGQAREGVMEGLAFELAFEGAALRHVSAVEHDRPDVGLVEEIGRGDVDGQPLPLGVGHPALEAGGATATSTEHLGQLRTDGHQVVGMDKIPERVPHERGGRAAKHDGDRWALVDDTPVGVEQSDQVRGVLHHGMKPALGPGQVDRSRCVDAPQRQGQLGG